MGAMLMVLTVLAHAAIAHALQVSPAGAVECAPWVPSGKNNNRCGSVVPFNSHYARLKVSVREGEDEPTFSDRKDAFINVVANMVIDLEDDSPCANDLLALVCFAVLPPCTPLPGTDVVWRERVCLDHCQQLTERCPKEAQRLVSVEAAAKVLGMSLQCDTLSYDDGYIYSTDTIYSASSPAFVDFPANGVVHQMPCTVPDAANATAQCQGDRVLNEQGQCSARCPVGIRVYSEDQWVHLDRTLEASGWISLACSILMLVTWSLQTRKRLFPSRFILYFSACLLLMSLAMVLSSIKGEDDMRCHNDSTPQTGTLSGTCLVQGMLWLTGSLGMTLWWLAFVVTLFLIIFKDVNTAGLQSKEWLFHLIVWPLCILPAIIAAAGGLIRYNPTGMLCFVTNEDGPGWQLGLYYVPQLALLLVGSILMGVILSQVCSNSRRIRTYKAVRAVIRFMVFIPLYVTILGVFLSASLRKLDVNDIIRDKYPVFNDCLVELNVQAGNGDNFENPEFLDQCAQKAFHSVQQFALDISSRVMFGLMGVWIVFIFGLQRRNWRFWKRQFGRLVGVVSSTWSSQVSGETGRGSKPLSTSRPSHTRLSRSPATASSVAMTPSAPLSAPATLSEAGRAEPPSPSTHSDGEQCEYEETSGVAVAQAGAAHST